MDISAFDVMKRFSLFPILDVLVDDLRILLVTYNQIRHNLT